METGEFYEYTVRFSRSPNAFWPSRAADQVYRLVRHEWTRGTVPSTLPPC